MPNVCQLDHSGPEALRLSAFCTRPICQQILRGCTGPEDTQYKEAGSEGNGSSMVQRLEAPSMEKMDSAAALAAKWLEVQHAQRPGLTA